MIPKLTKEQQAQYLEIGKRYDKERRKCEAQADALRPDKPELPEKPEGLSKEEETAFEDHVDQVITEWNEAGSDEWKRLRERAVQLVEEEIRERDAFLQAIFDEHFSKISGDVEKVVADAFETIDQVIEEDYQEVEYNLQYGSYRSKRVRATDDGFYLDAKAEREEIVKAIRANFVALQGNDEATNRINSYIDEALRKSDKVSARKGKLFGEIKPRTKKTTKESGVLLAYPEKFTIATTNIHNHIFGLSERGREKQVPRNFDKNKEIKQRVPLDSKKTISAFVSLDYSAFAEDPSITALPKLNGTDSDILDAIVSLMKAGNRNIPYSAIYRVWTAKLKGNIYMTDEDYEQIDATLDKAVGIVHIEQHETDNMGNDIGFDKQGAILMFQKGGITVNGRYVEKAIVVPDSVAGRPYTPILVEYAEYNNGGKELDSRDVEIRRIKGLSATKENLALIGVLYRRVIKMKNSFNRKNRWKKEDQELEENSRHIRFDYIYNAIGVLDPDKNKRRDIKEKVEKILKYWKSIGFITDYKLLRDKSHAISTIDILLVPEIEAKTN